MKQKKQKTPTKLDHLKAQHRGLMIALGECHLQLDIVNKQIADLKAQSAALTVEAEQLKK